MHDAFDNLHLADLHLEMAHLDEMDKHFNPDTEPKPPAPVDEPVTDDVGAPFDIMTETPRASDELLDPLS